MKTERPRIASFLTSTLNLFPVLALLALGATPVAAQINARGSDSTLHVVKALAEAFQKEAGTTVKVEGGGSSAGAKAVLAGEATLAFLSRDLKDAEKQAGLVGAAYAIDGVAVIAHKDNPAVNVTVAELKGYFSGTSANWPDGRPIVLFNRNADSGTRELFQDVVLGKDPFTEKATLKHDALLVSSVAKIPTSLTYTSAAEADESKVKVLTVNGVKPSAQALRDKSYPIVRTPTFATKGAASAAEKAFIDFVLSAKGQAIVQKEGLATLQVNLQASVDK